MSNYTPVSIITRLESTNSRNEKEQILTDAFMNDAFDFFVGAKLAYHPLISYGVKKVAEITEDDGIHTLTFTQFLALAKKLEKRELTGHAARDAIHDAAEKCNKNVWNLFYRRILLKDLKIGLEIKTLNKVLTKLKSYPKSKEFLIPVFGCQLAEDGLKYPKKLTGKKYIDFKFNGMRLLTFSDIDNKTVTQFTRNGKVNHNFNDIRTSLEKLLPKLPASIVLDGEIMSDSFQSLMKQANRKTDIDTSDAYLILFDIIPLDDFMNGKCDIPQNKRHEALCALETSGILQSISNGRIRVLPKIEVDLSTPEGQNRLIELKKEAARLKYEGVMVKDIDAPYVGKRTTAWFKIKPFISIDMEITGFIEGKGRNKGRMGTVMTEAWHDGKRIVTGVGGGWSDKLRQEIWDEPEKFRGQIIEVIADEITIAEGSDTYNLRFPNFERFRSIDGTPGEKV